MTNLAALRLGYPAKVKAILCLPLFGCLLVAWRMGFRPHASVDWTDLPIFIGGLLCGIPALLAVRSSCTIDKEGVTRRTLFGTRRYFREDFLAWERIALEPGQQPDLLLRFKTGIVFLGANQVDRPAQQIVDFLAAEWHVDVADYQPAALGAVDPVQTFEYEALHAGIVFAIAVLTLVAALRVPMFGLLGVVSLLCFRLVWRALGTLETDHRGLKFLHPFTGVVKIAWADVESAGYWSSFAQGGLRVRGGGKTIRVYRWIGGYPMLNRLLHDRLDAKCFWPGLQLPMRVDLNRRRRMGVLLPYFLLMANSLALIWEGNWTAFTAISVIPTFIAAALIFGSSRVLEFDKEEVRDVWRYMWFRKVNHFRREELLEARLGRQLSVGGLWMKFGDTRLEIANSDASLPPEQILMCLRQQWSWDRVRQDDRMRGAA